MFRKIENIKNYRHCLYSLNSYFGTFQNFQNLQIKNSKNFINNLIPINYQKITTIIEGNNTTTTYLINNTETKKNNKKRNISNSNFQQLGTTTNSNTNTTTTTNNNNINNYNNTSSSSSSSFITLNQKIFQNSLNNKSLILPSLNRFYCSTTIFNKLIQNNNNYNNDDNNTLILNQISKNNLNLNNNNNINNNKKYNFLTLQKNNYSIMVSKTHTLEEVQENQKEDLKKKVIKISLANTIYLNNKEYKDEFQINDKDDEEDITQHLNDENTKIENEKDDDMEINKDGIENVENDIYEIKMKIKKENSKTDSEATFSPKSSNDEMKDSDNENDENEEVEKYKIFYSCSNEPKVYRTNDLPSICKKDCGEDAYFTANQKNFSIFGVADGVGGWNKSGVDPSLFAWDLMNSCQEVSKELEDWPDPKTILNDGYELVVKKKIVKAGSSTACLMTFDRVSGILYSTNLGDSGFTIIRNNDFIFKTKEQQHYFNAPYQLSIIPDMTMFYLQNTPQDAYDDQFSVEDGDVIVMGTDGLWDNLYNDDILDVIKNDIKYIKESKKEVKTKEDYKEWENSTNIMLSGLAYQLTQKAKTYSHDWSRESPFSKKFNSIGQYYSGGKVDDITIILGYISKNPTTTDENN